MAYPGRMLFYAAASSDSPVSFNLDSRRLDPVVFGELDVLRGKMYRAADRCREIGKSERLLGYDDSWRAYMDLADEIKQLYPWIYRRLV